MTYDLTNRITLIENLQRMLRYLSFALNDSLLRVNINGEYDAQTERAVREYQNRANLPVTGITDLDTWNSIKKEYERERRLRDDIFIVPIPNHGDYGTERREHSDTVMILQIILSALRFVYEYPEVPISGIYGPQTEEAVRVFQQANGIRATGVADRNTWRLLTEEYNALVNQ